MNKTMLSIEVSVFGHIKEYFQIQLPKYRIIGSKKKICISRGQLSVYGICYERR